MSVDRREISVAINAEKAVSLLVENINDNKPEFVTEKLVVGISEQGYPDDPKQFVGSVTNFLLLKDEGSIDIERVVKELCHQTHGILGIKDAKWNLSGNITIKAIAKEHICNEGLDYKIGVASPVVFHQSMSTCHRLGLGNLTQIDSDEELNEVVSLFKSATDSCNFIWTPLSDEEEEGVFKNVVTKKIIDFLPWKPGAPNGGEDANNVFFELSDKTYSDAKASFKACTVCDVSVDTSFTLAGFCEDTFMGMNPSTIAYSIFHF